MGNRMPNAAAIPADEFHRLRMINSVPAPALAAIGEAWSRRSLVGEFVRRDIRVRYKQTVFGAAWAVMQPLLTMLVFTFVFSRLAKVPSEGIPYPVFAFCGLLPWQLFARGVQRSGNCLIEERHLLTRVYVPRLILPVAAVLGGLINFGVGFLALVALLLGYGRRPAPDILLLAPLLLLALVTTLGAGLFFSAWNVKYRDVGYTLPLLIQIWLFVTPVAYPSSLVPAHWRFLYGLNPMAAVVEGFRGALAGGATMGGTAMAASSACACAILLAGLACFARMDRAYADVV
jgi:lipopolysaccharide transport system permease protein